MSSPIILSADSPVYSAFNTFRVPMFASFDELDAIITMVQLQQEYLKENYFNRPLARNKLAVLTNRTYLKAIHILKRLTKKNLEEGVDNIEKIGYAVDYIEAVYPEYKDAKAGIVFP